MLDPSFVDALTDVGALGFAVIAVWALAVGKVVARLHYDRVIAERDEWKALALSAIERVDGLADAVADLAPKAKQ